MKNVMRSLACYKCNNLDFCENCTIDKIIDNAIIDYRNSIIDEYTDLIKHDSELGYVGYLDRVIDKLSKKMKEGK